MNARQANQAIFESLQRLYEDPAIRERDYYQAFRRQWDALFEKALADDASYLPKDASAVLAVEHRVFGADIRLHFDQLKIADWFRQEAAQRKRTVFQPQKLKRSRVGALTFHESPCAYNAREPEAALGDDMKNIIACALPGLPPKLRVVYGNKWVDARFTPLRQGSLSLFIIQTDFVPAFLADPFEICTYLFLMDCCIVKENHEKVKDEELRQFLHIFRPSPMLQVKNLKTAQSE